jgi:hypothetical protein
MFIMPTQNPKKILIEVMYKADYCLPCLYMDETVREVVPKYVKYVDYQRVDFMKGQGKKRFLELSNALFGEKGVRKHFRLVPVPSLFINGELFLMTSHPNLNWNRRLRKFSWKKVYAENDGMAIKSRKNNKNQIAGLVNSIYKEQK